VALALALALAAALLAVPVRTVVDAVFECEDVEFAATTEEAEETAAAAVPESEADELAAEPAVVD